MIETHSRVIGSFASLIPAMIDLAKSEIKIAGDAIVDRARDNATGGNKNTISAVPIDDFGVRVQAVGWAPTVQELGSVEHIIAPKNYPDGVLSWVGSDGVRRFARFVIHPGTSKKPFLGPAALRYEPILRARMLEGLNEISKRKAA